jgi:pSer/pThr/pTyr-binding forkhead associated (FHA) protein
MFVFDAPSSCVLGRGDDCGLHIPNDAAHRTVSRHHCMVAVDPPNIWVRDLGSMNGTYVNSIEIGHRPFGPLLPTAPRHGVTCQLEEGDAIQAGNVVLSVHVYPHANSLPPAVDPESATVGREGERMHEGLAKETRA